MKALRKTKSVWILMGLAFVGIAFLWLSLRHKPFFKQDFPNSRPFETDIYIYDYADILEDTKESTDRYLANFKRDYATEMVIVTLSALPQAHSIESLAVELFSNWRIGEATGGRGILLLFAVKEQLIKIELSYELEDVFTDIFCGYIEDKQLKPYFLSDQIDIGLVAVLEEIEQRVQVKHKENYSVADLYQLDQELLSGGAGAKRQLTDYQKEKISAVGQDYPAGRTPDEAWHTLIRSWEHKVRDPNLGVYTEITRLAYREFQNLPDSRYEEDVLTYKNKPYEVIENNNYAVIFFGKKKGWQNAPFLFCRTAAGWQFDIVHQRKYVRMGKNPHWGIERSEYPYVDLLSRCPYWMNQDIPLEGGDIYSIERDRKLAEEIKGLEQVYENDSENFQTAMRLGELYTITSLSPKKRILFLKKARQLDALSSKPCKYLGIAYLDGFYQFDLAIKEIKTYVEQRPEDVFGRNYLGYLYYCTKRYKAAIGEFNKAVQLKPDNCYAFAKLARSYARLFLNSSKIDPRRSGYRKSAVEMFDKSSTVDTPDLRRLNWLKRFLFRKEILN